MTPRLRWRLGLRDPLPRWTGPVNVEVRAQFAALKPLPEPELRDKMRHGPMLRAVRGIQRFQREADRILRRVG